MEGVGEGGEAWVLRTTRYLVAAVAPTAAVKVPVMYSFVILENVKLVGWLVGVLQAIVPVTNTSS